MGPRRRSEQGLERPGAKNAGTGRAHRTAGPPERGTVLGYPPAGGGNSCHSTSSRSSPRRRFTNAMIAATIAPIAASFMSFFKNPPFFSSTVSTVTMASSAMGEPSFREWAWMDLNHRPLPYQGSALTGLSYRPLFPSEQPTASLLEACPSSLPLRCLRLVRAAYRTRGAASPRAKHLTDEGPRRAVSAEACRSG